MIKTCIYRNKNFDEVTKQNKNHGEPNLTGLEFLIVLTGYSLFVNQEQRKTNTLQNIINEDILIDKTYLYLKDL